MSATASQRTAASMTTVKEAYRDQQEILCARPVGTILDIGAHTGEITAIYRAVFPEASIYGFEPFPSSFEQYRHQFQNDSLVKPLQLAISNYSGTGQFHVNRNSQTNSCLAAVKEASYWTDSPDDIEDVATIEVPTISIDEFCQREGLKNIDILKMDVQGGELLALQGATRQLSHASIRLIYAEVLFVPQYEGQAHYYQIAEYLSRFGYSMFDLYNQAYSEKGNLKWADAIFISPQITSALMHTSMQAGRRKVERDYQCAALQDQMNLVQYERDRLLDERNDVRHQNEQLVTGARDLNQKMQKLQDDMDWLLESLKAHEQELGQKSEELRRLTAEKTELQAIWNAVQGSTGWRALNRWRMVRDRFLPANSLRRRMCKAFARSLRGNPPGAVKPAEQAAPAPLTAEVEKTDFGGVQVAQVDVVEPGAWIQRLTNKWHEIPMTILERGSSLERLSLPDAEFLAWWDGLEQQMLAQPEVYWVIEVYRDFVRGKKMIEVGPGAGVIGVQFLRAGAQITFMDVVESNLKLVERVCRLKGIEGASFFPLRDFTDPLNVSDDFDAVFARGSLHHTPAEVVKPEFEALASRIKIGGRFLVLTYPKERWVRDGSKPFNEWGKNTDGDTTPWAEWYDTAKLLAQLKPYEFRALMAFNMDAHGLKNEFNWFDLQRIG